MESEYRPKNILEQKCEGCGAPMRFDPKKELLICDSCGSKKDFSTKDVRAESMLRSFDFEKIKTGFADPNAAKLPIYICNSCGAEIITSATQAAMTCPFCRNNIVITDRVTGNLRPNGIIPFKIEPAKLPGLLRKTYGKKKLLPRDFFSSSTMQGVTGIYVPFWMFSGTIAGEGDFIGSNTVTTVVGDYDVHTTNHYQFGRGMSFDFEGIPADASKKIDDALMDSIQPFDMNEVKPFDTSYLAGYTADRFDEASEDMNAKIKRRVENTAEDMMRRKFTEYNNVRRIGGNAKIELTARYYLLPVYMFDIHYNNEIYKFAVNGQNGTTVGDVPTVASEKRKFFLKNFLPVSAAILILFLIKYFVGW